MESLTIPTRGTPVARSWRSEGGREGGGNEGQG